LSSTATLGPTNTSSSSRPGWQPYTATFVEIAISRGWRPDDAVTWPVGIGGAAFIEAYRYDWDPGQAAEADVIACEATH
jgi:hypothetical protein